MTCDFVLNKKSYILGKIIGWIVGLTLIGWAIGIITVHI